MQLKKLDSDKVRRTQTSIVIKGTGFTVFSKRRQQRNMEEFENSEQRVIFGES
jgi:hypothetical protein